VLGFMTDFSGPSSESKPNYKPKADVSFAPDGGRFTLQGAF
jgi:hypothetical protein